VSAQDMATKSLPSDLDMASLMPSATADHFAAFNKALLPPIVSVDDEFNALDFDIKDTIEVIANIIISFCVLILSIHFRLLDLRTL
jgi:hypothetical protein